MKPNLFDFATSELSADAVICWLFAWGNDPNSEFYSLVKDLLAEVTAGQFMGEVHTIEITRQFHNIDILLQVNDELIIAIENKINTREHSNQLERYQNVIREKFATIDEKNQYFVYWKPVNDSDFFEVFQKNYYVLTRARLLHHFSAYAQISNAIFNDYYHYLLTIEEETNSYEKFPTLKEWSYRSWQGFYTELQKQKNPQKKCWSYVANPRGGFLAFYWQVKSHLYEGEVYYIFWQIEQNRIALKLEVPKQEHRKLLREQLIEQLTPTLSVQHHEKLKVQKTKAKTGKHMTLAEITGFETKEELLEAIQLAESL